MRCCSANGAMSWLAEPPGDRQPLPLFSPLATEGNLRLQAILWLVCKHFSRFRSGSIFGTRLYYVAFSSFNLACGQLPDPKCVSVLNDYRKERSATRDYAQPGIRPMTTGVLAVGLALLLAGVAGCKGEGKAAKEVQPPPPSVVVAEVIQKTVAIYSEFVAQSDAMDTVEIRARLPAFLEQLHFTEGTMVKKDQLLFTLDKREYEAQLDQARAAAVAVLTLPGATLLHEEQFERRRVRLPVFLSPNTAVQPQSAQSPQRNLLYSKGWRGGDRGNDPKGFGPDALLA